MENHLYMASREAQAHMLWLAHVWLPAQSTAGLSVGS